MHLNQFFDQIYLINLERRPLKLIQCLYQFKRYQIKVKIVPAIDGYHPKYYYSNRPNKDNIPAGAYGYILSWIKTLNHAKQHNFKKILIFDDDIILKQNFNQEFENWIKHFKPITWKLLLLGASQHSTIPNHLINHDIHSYYPLHTDGSFAVGIHHTVIPELLKLLNQKDQLVDSHCLRHLYAQFHDECFVANPNLIIADVSQSDIRTPRDQIQLSEKLNWHLESYHYPIQRPLVTIIVPVYKAERTIKRSLQSLLDQTYRPLEILIINDGSPDNTLDEINQTLNSWIYHPRAKNITFKLFHQSQNQGCYPSRNIGLTNATGEMITFQDADDVSLDERITKQVIHLLKYDVDMVSTQILRTHLTNLSSNKQELENDINRTRIHQNSYCCRAKIGLVTILFKKNIFNRYGHYPIFNKWGEDATFLHKIFPNAPLHDSYKIMNYLNDTKYLPKKYYQIPEILYLSHEMTEHNLTTQRQAHEKIQST